jgi:hypothetical protein
MSDHHSRRPSYQTTFYFGAVQRVRSCPCRGAAAASASAHRRRPPRLPPRPPAPPQHRCRRRRRRRTRGLPAATGLRGPRDPPIQLLARVRAPRRARARGRLERPGGAPTGWWAAKVWRGAGRHRNGPLRPRAAPGPLEPLVTWGVATLLQGRAARRRGPPARPPAAPAGSAWQTRPFATFPPRERARAPPRRAALFVFGCKKAEPGTADELGESKKQGCVGNGGLWGFTGVLAQAPTHAWRPAPPPAAGA